MSTDIALTVTGANQIALNVQTGVPGPPDVSADAGNALTEGSDGLPFLAVAHPHAQSDITGLVAALALLAPLASPAFTETPTVPTAAPGTNTTQAANTAFVQAAIAALVNSSPAALDTLFELAAALGNDANFATTVTNALAGKAALSHTHAQSDVTGLVAALALLAPLASPAFTGTPTVPTAAPGTNTTQAANTAFVQAAIAALVNSSPAALDTLIELATALGNDANFATTVTNALAGKQPLADVLTALSTLTDAPGLLESVTGDPRTFAIRAIGAGASTSILDRAAGDVRYAGRPIWMRLTADRNLSNVDTPQALFETPSDTATLAAGVYEFFARVVVDSMSSTTGNLTFSLKGAGTAVVADTDVQSVIGRDLTGIATGTAATPNIQIFTNTDANPVANATTGTALLVEIRGEIDVSTGGTMIPTITLAHAAAAVAKLGCFVKFLPLGDTGATGYGVN